MIDQFSSDDGHAESLLREAADCFPAVSPDLRPRVLEAARACHRRRARSRLVVSMAAVVVLLVGIYPPGRSAETPHRRLVNAADTAADANRRSPNSIRCPDLLACVEAVRGTPGIGRDFALVDGFTQLRKQQLRTIHEAF